MNVRFPWFPKKKEPAVPEADAETQQMPAFPQAPALTPGEPAIIGKLMIEAFGASDPGCVRGNNEDCFLVAPVAGLYLVADGMGGAQAGEHASKMATDTVMEVVSATPGNIDIARLAGAIEEANRRLKAASAADPALQGMGTTVVAAAERGGELVIASVGDSRAYRFRDGNLTAITEDQTWVNEVGRKLGLDETALRAHPMRHVLTMAVGVSENLRINTYCVQPAPGETILLSSDGLHGVVADEDIATVLAAPGTIEQTARRLIKLARDRGGPDNVTVVVLRVGERPGA